MRTLCAKERQYWPEGGEHYTLFNEALNRENNTGENYDPKQKKTIIVPNASLFTSL